MSTMFRSSVEKSNTAEGDEHIYYNGTIFNNTTAPIRAEFNESRTVPLLETPADWKMAFVRFYIPGNLIPLLTLESTPQPFPALPTLPYFVTIEFPVGNFITQQLDFVSDNVNYFLSNDPLFNNPSISFYTTLLKMVNNAFSAIWVANPGLGGTTYPPSFHYDTSDSSIRLTTEAQIFYPGRLLANNVVDPAAPKIWMSYNLGIFFDAFPNFFNSYTDTVQGINLWVDYDHGDNQTFIASFPATTFIQTIQESNSLYLWSDMARIVFTSGQIPIRQEAQFSHLTNSNNVQAPILIDFAPVLNNTFQVHDVFQYAPPSQYRWIDLKGTTPLIAIDTKIFIQKKNGDLQPLFIAPNQVISFKMLFQKKTKEYSGIVLPSMEMSNSSSPPLLLGTGIEEEQQNHTKSKRRFH